MAEAYGGERHSGTAEKHFFTPPPNSRHSSYALKACKSETHYKIQSSVSSPSSSCNLFHVIHKVPAGDSPYVWAKRAQLIDKDPSRAISLFWRAINSGDRVDSALKDMAVVMKQLDRSNEAIEAIKSFRHLCSNDAQDSLDNILIELYKRSGRLDDQIEILQNKVKRIEESAASGKKRTKMARSQGKKIQITAEQEYSRLLGNLAWAHLQQNNYKVAEEFYRKALSIELDRNKQCNLAVCLMYMDRINEAILLLQSIRFCSVNQEMDESFTKSYERASELLEEIESHTFRKDKPPVFGRGNHTTQSSFASDDDEEYTRNNCFVNEFECQSQADNDQVANGFQSLQTPNTPTAATRWGGYSPYNSHQEDSSARKQGDFESCFIMSPRSQQTTKGSPLGPRICTNSSPYTQPKRCASSSLMLGDDGRNSNGKFRSCPNRRLQFQDQSTGQQQAPPPPPPMFHHPQVFHNSKGAGVLGSGKLFHRKEGTTWVGSGVSFPLNSVVGSADQKYHQTVGSPLPDHSMEENHATEETKEKEAAALSGSSVASSPNPVQKLSEDAMEVKSLVNGGGSVEGEGSTSFPGSSSVFADLKKGSSPFRPQHRSWADIVEEDEQKMLSSGLMKG